MKKPGTLMKASWFAVGLVWFPLFALFEVIVLVTAVALTREAFFAPPKAPPPPAYGDPGEAPSEIAPFIPAGWRVEQHAATNLDSDGSGDLVLLLGPSQEGFGPTDNTPLLDRCRNLLLLYGKEGGYERAQYLPWRLRLVVDPDERDERTGSCHGSDFTFEGGSNGEISISQYYAHGYRRAELLPRGACLELIGTEYIYDIISWAEKMGERYHLSEELDLRMNTFTRVVFHLSLMAEEPPTESEDEPSSRSTDQLARAKAICAENFNGIFSDIDEPTLVPELAALIPPTIPFADVDAPFQPEAPTARAGCATPPQAMMARTAQAALPLRIRSEQTPSAEITTSAAATVFSLGQTVLEATERCTHQAATLWAEDDCGLWFRFDRATDCPYDVEREGPLDSGDWWHDDQPLEWSGALGSYFVLPRERDGSYLLSSLPSISNACEGPCKNEILPIRFNRLGRGRFAATTVRAEDVPPPERAGRF